MIPLVADASVALKWFIGGRPGEGGVNAAMALLRAVADREVAPLKPPHICQRSNRQLCNGIEG